MTPRLSSQWETAYSPSIRWQMGCFMTVFQCRSISALLALLWFFLMGAAWGQESVPFSFEPTQISGGAAAQRSGVFLADENEIDLPASALDLGSQARGNQLETDGYAVFSKQSPDWVALFTGVLACVALLQLFAIGWQVWFMGRAWKDSRYLAGPLVIMEMPETGRIKGNCFYPDSPRFCLHNLGASPAIVYRICRHWEATTGRPPSRIDPDNPPKGALLKEDHFPVGPGQRTHERWSGGKRFHIPANNRIWFLGFIEYRDLLGRRWRSGFCFVGDRAVDGSVRLHRTWPRNASEYHYTRKLPKRWWVWRTARNL